MSDSAEPREGLRARLLGAVAEFARRRSALAIGVVVVAFLVSAVIASGLGVSTSRTGLVSEEDPTQADLVRFHETFGRPEYAVFVVTGGDADGRRAMVDALLEELQTHEDLQGRVLGRITADAVAPVAILQQPGGLAQARRSLPPDVDFAALVEGGIVGWFGALEEQIYAGLDGADEAEDEVSPGDDGAGAAVADPLAAASEGLGQLASAAQLLDDVIAGADPLQRLVPGGGPGDLGIQGIDERGYLVTADGEHHLVTVFAELPSDEGTEVEPVVTRIRAARDRAAERAPDDVRAILTGMPALIVDELEIVTEGLVLSSLATGVGITVLCLLLFRSLWQAIVALVPLLPGIVITFAFVRAIYGHLNLITSSMVAVLLGLGIDFSVHAIARFNEQRRQGQQPGPAVVEAMRRTGPGITTGAVVTAAAFLTTMTTDFTAFAELGLVTAIGLFVISGSMFVLVPALLARTRSSARPSPEPPGLDKLPGLLRRGRLALVVLGVAGGIAGGVALPRIEFNSRYFDFLPDDTEAAQGLALLEYDALASPVFANMSADTIEEARSMAQQLRGMDSVAGVSTPSDFLPPLTDASLAGLRADVGGLARDPDFDLLAAKTTTPPQLAKAARSLADALEEARAALRSAGRDTEGADAAVRAFSELAARAKALDDAGAVRLAGLEAQAAQLLAPAWATAKAVAERGTYAPSDVPAAFAPRFVAKDGSRVALYAVPAGSFWEPEVAKVFEADAREVDPDVSGLAVVHVAHGQMVLEGFLAAAAFAAVLVVVLLVLDFRSFIDALLALLPTALGWLWMLGIMAAVGIDFDVANIVCLPLVLGIGIAFGVHLMHRVREGAGAGGPAQGSLDEAVRGTGGAVAVAALTTIVGFAGLMAGRYGGMYSLGLTMVIGIATCLVATVLVLPSVLLLLRRVR